MDEAAHLSEPKQDSVTRRLILQQAVCVPVAVSLNSSRGVQILAAPDCLSRESAAGFRSVLKTHSARDLVVVCGPIDALTALCLRRRALNGARIIWEISPHAPQPRLLEETFGIRIGRPLVTCRDELFVRYRWPYQTLTRSFSSVTPVYCPDDEVIAHCGAMPIAMKRRLNRAKIIVLGAMLGPNLRAEEPQSRLLINKLALYLQE